MFKKYSIQNVIKKDKKSFFEKITYEIHRKNVSENEVFATAHENFKHACGVFRHIS